MNKPVTEAELIAFVKSIAAQSYSTARRMVASIVDDARSLNRRLVVERLRLREPWCLEHGQYAHNCTECKPARRKRQ